MFEIEKIVSLLMLGVVALIAVVSLVLMFNGGTTGAVAKSVPVSSRSYATVPSLVSKIDACKQLLTQQGVLGVNRPVDVNCVAQTNGVCDTTDDCKIGIRHGKCNAQCQCITY